MKKAICFCLLSCLLLGCTKQSSIAKGNDIGSFITQDGMYFINDTKNDMRILDYYDFKAGKTVAVGDNINCKEEDASCRAVQLTTYKERRLILLKSYHNNIYLFYQGQDAEGSYLMKADSKGENLETVFTLPKATMMQMFEIYEDKIFFVYNKMGYLDKSKTSYGVSGDNIVSVYDLKTKKQTDLTKSDAKKDGFAMYIGFEHDKAYYIDYSYKKQERPIYAYDIKKGKTELIDSGNLIDTSMLYDGKLYVADEKEKKIYSYNIATKKKETLTNFQPYKAGDFISQSRDGIVQLSYVVNPNKDNTKRYVQAYDEKEKKFLFTDYREGYEVTNRCSVGYIGTKNYQWGLYDKDMKFKQF